MECQPVALLPLLWAALLAQPLGLGMAEAGLVLLVGVGGSVLLLRRLLRQAWRPWLGVSLVPLALGLGSSGWLVGDCCFSSLAMGKGVNGVKR